MYFLVSVLLFISFSKYRCVSVWNQAGGDWRNTKRSTYQSKNKTKYTSHVIKNSNSIAGSSSRLSITSQGMLFLYGIEDEDHPEIQNLYVIDSETAESKKILSNLPGKEDKYDLGEIYLGGTPMLSGEDALVFFTKFKNDKCISINFVDVSGNVTWKYEIQEYCDYKPSQYSSITSNDDVSVIILRDPKVKSRYELVGIKRGYPKVQFAFSIETSIEKKYDLGDILVDENDMMYIVNNSNTIIKFDPHKGTILKSTIFDDYLKFENPKPVISKSLNIVYLITFNADDMLSYLFGFDRDTMNVLFKSLLPVSTTTFPGGPCFTPCFNDNEKQIYVNCANVEDSEVMVINPKNGSCLAEKETVWNTCVDSYDIAMLKGEDDVLILSCDAGMLEMKDEKFTALDIGCHEEMYIVDSSNCMFYCETEPLRCHKKCF